MKLRNKGSFGFLQAASLVALLAAGMILRFPGQAPADDVGYDEMLAPLAGKADGGHGLSVSWEVKFEVPGQIKRDGEENAWLVVTSSLDGKNLPGLYLEGDYVALSALSDTDSFSLVALEDYNFDGHDDMRLAVGASARGTYGPIYLFNPEAGRFEKSESFSELQSPYADPNRKRVDSLVHESFCHVVMQEFVVKGFDTLELVLEEGMECPDELLEKEQYRSFRRIYENGNLISDESDLHPLDEAGEPGEPEAVSTTNERLVADNGGFSAELPKGWTVREEDSFAIFESDGQTPQTILCRILKFENFDLDVYLQRQSRDGKWARFNGLSYVYVAPSGDRSWFAIISPGELFEIVVGEPVAALPEFLRSLRTTEETREFKIAFMDAGSREVIDWLTFATPEMPADASGNPTPSRPERAAFKPFSGNNLKARVPDGWTIDTEGPFVHFTAPGGRDDGYAAGASIALDGKFINDVGMAIINELGGVNVYDFEGMLSFQIDGDQDGLIDQYGDTLLLKISQPGNKLSSSLADSIQLLEW